MNRREFLALTALSSTYAFTNSRFAFAADGLIRSVGEPVTVVIFLRGAMDGLSLLPPIDDPNYFAGRPNIAIGDAQTKTSKLKDGFGLHPSMVEVRKLFENGEANYFFEAGSPAKTRSHFDAQDWMESGHAEQLSNDVSGFMGRASLKLGPKNQPDLQSGFSTVAVQAGYPRILKGAPGGLAFPEFKALKIKGPLTRDGLDGKKDENIDPAIAKLYGQSQDPLFHHAAQTFLQGSGVVARAEEIFEDEKKALPKGPLAKNLAQISALVRSDIGVKIAVTEMGGWDTHVNQGNAQSGSLKDRLAELDGALASFWKSLGNRKDQVCVVVMTEFGRTARENGDRGTDHGHGSTFMVLNGRLKSPRIYHEFKGMAEANLNEGRDLNVRFDYRQIFAEVLTKHARLGASLGEIFPKFTPGPELGLFRGL